MIAKETRSVGGVVINRKRQVLVVSQHGASWSLPKGHIEDGETPLEAAKREIEEESGITDLKFIKNLGTYKRFKISLDGGEDKSEIKIISMFLFSTSQEEINPKDSENPEARWINKTQVVKLLTHKKDKEFFLKISKEI